MIHNVQMFLTIDDEEVTTVEQAAELAEGLCGNVVPTQPESGDPGVWLCDIHEDLFATLQEVGWLGVENGPFAAETEWPDA